MTKHELIGCITRETGISRDTVEHVLSSLSRQAQTALYVGEEVILPGIGRLSAAHRNARMGRNMATGEAVEIAARRVAKFTPAKALKSAINA
ncbi:HU family DNA-binding protein [Azoarcus communis]|uniref:HU family DNA-binding protein n=1 Tax=Parazoarcus communis TaxID=41977 RepID=UPI001459CE41|nr:HU family DNA-binding protein [Parazoarcus communis]NMG48260.1 HU family DNA-binding protein [Parazoarcus communis]